MFKLNDYHAINSANIKIDGITVLAGINGCGKSTISRWLYYFVNASHRFEYFQRKYFVDSLVAELEKVQRVFRSSPKWRSYVSAVRQLRRVGDNSDFEELRETYFSIVRKAEEDLHEYLRGRRPDDSYATKMLASFLIGKEASGNVDVEELIELYIRDCFSAFDIHYKRYLDKVNLSARKDLERVITSEFSDGEPLPQSLLLVEGETPLIDSNSFSSPLLLNRAIYIDSPMAVSGSDGFWENAIWSDFNHYLFKENPQRKNEEVQLLCAQIQSVIEGEFRMEDDQFGFEQEIHYVSQEQGIDINISDAATGVKSFAYLFQLLKNGWLGEDSLLLIDEPEAHLHPQWIVEFARLLVRINKSLGVKMVLASHNPDMVAAIQSIATKEGVIDKTVFYLAQKGRGRTTYDFVDKGTDIGDIFSSFNIALSRIELYGTAVI